jgi:ketosteroid isomerase-like protein
MDLEIKGFMTSNKQLLKKISEEFARGNLSFFEEYLAEDIKWNILGEVTIVGKEQVLQLSKMTQLQSFPVIKIKNIISEGDYVVIESTGEAKTIEGKSYNQVYCEVFRFDNEKLQEITTYLDTALSKEALADS